MAAYERVLERGSAPTLGLILIAIVACPLLGQGRDRLLSLSVLDSTGSPVDGAAAMLAGDLGHWTRRETTGKQGRLTVVVPTSGEYQLAIRKIGYAPFDSSIRVGTDDTTRVTARVRRLAVVFDTMRVIARESLKERSYHIDADVIAANARRLFDGFDIIAKLRPDIAWGRGFCHGAINVWVNGRWIPPEVVLVNDVAKARANAGNAAGHVSRTVLYVLTSIKPEHVAEMTYHDCTDTSIGGMHAQSALFVILKPGVVYDPGRGSYVPAAARREFVDRRDERM